VKTRNSFWPKRNSEADGQFSICRTIFSAVANLFRPYDCIRGTLHGGGDHAKFLVRSQRTPEESDSFNLSGTIEQRVPDLRQTPWLKHLLPAGYRFFETEPNNLRRMDNHFVL
jgi:hypothetical protein